MKGSTRGGALVPRTIWWKTGWELSVAAGAPCSRSGGRKLWHFREADIPSSPSAPSASPSSSLLPSILWLTLPSQPLRIFRMRSQRKLALNPTHSARCFGGQLWWGFLKAHLDLTTAASADPRALVVSVSPLWKASFWAQSPQWLVGLSWNSEATCGEIEAASQIEGKTASRTHPPPSTSIADCP